MIDVANTKHSAPGLFQSPRTGIEEGSCNVANCVVLSETDGQR